MFWRFSGKKQREKVNIEMKELIEFMPYEGLDAQKILYENTIKRRELIQQFIKNLNIKIAELELKM